MRTKLTFKYSLSIIISILSLYQNKTKNNSVYKLNFKNLCQKLLNCTCKLHLYVLYGSVRLTANNA